jgi:ankyrin repeat protein
MLKWQIRSKKVVVKGGAAVNDANGYGNTLLMSAAHESNLEVLRYLTEFGPDIDIPNYYDDSAQQLAVLSDIMDIIKHLLYKGISVDLTGRGDST